MARQIKTDEKYLGRLLKLIPSEMVAVYLAVQGIIPPESAKWGLLIVSLVLLIITPFYLRMVQKVDRIMQIILSSLSFAVWIYSMGGPFIHLKIYEPWIASVVILLWTTFAPQFFRTMQENAGDSA